LKDVRLSGRKSAIIASICASPSLSHSATLERLINIGEYFAYGGQNTLTLFKVHTPLPTTDLAAFAALFGQRHTKTIVDGVPFRFDKASEINYHGKQFFSAKFEYPGGWREVDDFNTGPLNYTLAAPAECIFRNHDGSVILDIRCTAAQAVNFAKCISSIVWGKDVHGAPTHSARLLLLSHDLTMKLRERFGARSYQVKVSEGDEEVLGRFHPSTTEFTSKKWDLTAKRKKLGVSSAAEDMAHGLEFNDVYEGISMKAGCKINLHYPTSQVRFMKISSFGSYDSVINAILELSHV